MVDTRKPLIPTTRIPPNLRTDYDPSKEGMRVVAPRKGTIISNGNPVRTYFDVGDVPKIVMLETVDNGPQVDGWIAYYVNEPFPAAPFAGISLPKLPLYGNRIAYLWGSGRWYIDLQCDTSIDFVEFEVRDPVEARSLIDSLFSESTPSITSESIPDQTLAAATPTVIFTPQQIALYKAIVVQNVGAGSVRIALGSTPADAVTGILLPAASATQAPMFVFKGSLLAWNELTAFSTAGTDIAVQIYTGWRPSV